MEHTEVKLDNGRPGLAVITLNGPERLNALNQRAVVDFCETLDALGRDDKVRVVLITGAGKGFCSGWDIVGAPTDLSGALLQTSPTISDTYASQELFASMVQRLRALDKVVIAGVNGAAVGAGFALTLAADIRVAGRSASFHVGAVRIGLTAGECGISYHLPRLIGASRAFEVMLTGRPIKADEAERIGLVSLLVDDAQLFEQALETANQVLRNSPYATRHTKRLMWANLEAGSLDAALELENHAQVLALMTEDLREASTAFKEKRPPVFTGR